jgi:hypothetical protein
LLLRCGSCIPAVSRTAIFSRKKPCSTGTGVCGSQTSAVASPPRAPRRIAPMDSICFDGTFLPASDVFAFGLSLLESLTGALGESASVTNRVHRLLQRAAAGDSRFHSASPRQLIQDCWATDRPSKKSWVG